MKTERGDMPGQVILSKNDFYEDYIKRFPYLSPPDGETQVEYYEEVIKKCPKISFTKNSLLPNLKLVRDGFWIASYSWYPRKGCRKLLGKRGVENNLQ